MVMLRFGQRGIGKFEFVVVIVIICTLLGVLLQRLIWLQGESERAEVELIVTHIRSGLRLAMVQNSIQGHAGGGAGLSVRNPVTFLASPPKGYTLDPLLARQPGAWHFDPVSRQLIYRPRLPEAFAGKAELRWRLQAAGNPGAAIDDTEFIELN